MSEYSCKIGSLKSTQHVLSRFALFRRKFGQQPGYILYGQDDREWLDSGSELLAIVDRDSQEQSSRTQPIHLLISASVMSSKITVDPLPVYPDIIISLLYMGSEPLRFHWILFIQSPNSTSGTKFHATGYGDDWKYERISYDLQFDVGVSAGAIIGKLSINRTLDQLDALLKEIPMKVPNVDVQREPRWTCRVWIREALRHMHHAGFIDCPDVDVLEAEMWELGKVAAKAIDDETFTVAKISTAKNSR